MSNSDAPEYAELKNAADQIRATLELARFEFERHKVIHQADANTRTYAGYTSLWRWRIKSAMDAAKGDGASATER